MLNCLKNETQLLSFGERLGEILNSIADCSVRSCSPDNFFEMRSVLKRSNDIDPKEGLFEDVFQLL